MPYWPAVAFGIFFVVLLSAFRSAQRGGLQWRHGGPVRDALILAAALTGIAWAAAVGLGIGRGAGWLPEGCHGVIGRGGMDTTC